MKSTNLIIIGIGPHAKRSYLPTLYRYQTEWGLNIKLGVDIHEKFVDIKNYLVKNNFDLPMLFIEPFTTNDVLPPYLENYLNRFVQENNIDGVILSTEPLVHHVYAKWALGQGLNILMDKPISTRENVICDINQAKGILEDYLELHSLYNKLQSKKQTIFSVNVQRRYHDGHRKVISLIKETADQFDAPVTSIQSTHADGQWRMPNEIVDQVYHPYCQGYGKCSHSGYHLFDIVSQYYQAGSSPNKRADSAELIASFLQPRGFIQQFNQENYMNYFGPDYQETQKRDEKTLYALYENYGEMDAAILLRLLSGQDNICHITINLLHNSFARRTWLQPGDDLYKGNGRVKHEHHVIQQGPFQCIQVHSYQSNDRHDHNTEADDQLGGNNHFDIYVFRNQGMFGSCEQPLQIYNLKNIGLKEKYDNFNLAYEKTKEFVLLEFIEFIQGKITQDKLVSNINTHDIPVNIMSAVYQSHRQYIKKINPWIKLIYARCANNSVLYYKMIRC